MPDREILETTNDKRYIRRDAKRPLHQQPGGGRRFADPGSPKAGEEDGSCWPRRQRRPEEAFMTTSSLPLILIVDEARPLVRLFELGYQGFRTCNVLLHEDV